jgi:hypothetical protein
LEKKKTYHEKFEEFKNSNRVQRSYSRIENDRKVLDLSIGILSLAVIVLAAGLFFHLPLVSVISTAAFIISLITGTLSLLVSSKRHRAHSALVNDYLTRE